jgi:hypothetical protein
MSLSFSEAVGKKVWILGGVRKRRKVRDEMESDGACSMMDLDMTSIL